jgi:hypothetical protein
MGLERVFLEQECELSEMLNEASGVLDFLQPISVKLDGAER